MSELLSAVILIVFTLLVAVAAVSTTLRWFRYHARRMQTPVLLPRDRDLFLGLVVPFLLIAAVRAFPDLRAMTLDADGYPHIWWQLLTGLPPIYAVARYVYFELWVIER